jgi:AcrR family transcriptional regulator
MEASTRTQRADAKRNREAVIETAIDLLGRDPSASMSDIAAASRVGRTTVYRHFPTRDDLLVAMFGRVIEESREMTKGVVECAGSAEDLLRRLTPAMIQLGLRFRFLHVYRHLGQQTLESSKQVPDDPVRVYLAEARERGEVRAGLSDQWIASTIQALAIAALDDLHAGFTDEAGAELQLADTLVAAIVARRLS